MKIKVKSRKYDIGYSEDDRTWWKYIGMRPSGTCVKCGGEIGLRKPCWGLASNEVPYSQGRICEDCVELEERE